MARFNNSNSDNRPVADAFLNISVKTNGEEKRLGKNGIPLYLDNAFHSALIDHIKGGGEIVLTCDMHEIVEDSGDYDFSVKK